jgi:kinesin family protein 3/17
VEKVIEKEVVVERLVGVSAEEVARIRSELEAAKEAEKDALRNENLVQREEALRAQAALLEQQAMMAAEAQRVAAAEAKLRDLEAKLIGHNGENLIDAHAKQAQELERYQAELRRRELEEAAAAAALQERQEELDAREVKYGSLQEEADEKGRKLKKLYAKYKAAQAEIGDLQAEFQREREDMLETVRAKLVRPRVRARSNRGHAGRSGRSLGHTSPEAAPASCGMSSRLTRSALAARCPALNSRARAHVCVCVRCSCVPCVCAGARAEPATQAQGGRDRRLRAARGAGEDREPRRVGRGQLTRARTPRLASHSGCHALQLTAGATPPRS